MKTRSIRIVIWLIALLAGVGCTHAIKNEPVQRNKPHIDVMFSLRPDFYPKLFKIKTCQPQIAIWAEEPVSGYRETLYVTMRGGKNNWLFASERPSALPVWNGVAKTKDTDVDAISGATPTGESFQVSWQVPNNLLGAKLNIYIEANVSFDYNDFYTDSAKPGDPGYSDVNGQPSIVWRGEMDLKENEQIIFPSIIGHGQVLGENHEIESDMKTVTTAKELFGYIKIQYHSGIRKIDDLETASKK